MTIERRLLSERFQFQPMDSVSSYSATQRQMLADFKRRLEDKTYRLINEPCPCASDSNEVLIAEIDRYGLPLESVLCLACGTVRIDPYLDPPSLESFYRELYQDLYGRAVEPAEYFERQRAYGRRILATLRGSDPTSGSVLEIGCGAGGGLSEFAAAGFHVAGCDYSDTLIDFGTHRGVPNLCVGGIEEVRRSRPQEKFDLVFLHHVYEHVGKPLALLEEIQPILAPGGKVLIIVPELSRIDRFVIPAGNALEFFHVAHKYNYSFTGISHIARQAGMTARRVTPPRRMRTAWSRSPELWVEITAGLAAQRPAVDELSGEQLWDYLQRTERLYQWGLCRAQVLTTIRNLSPERVLSRWLRRAG